MLAWNLGHTGALDLRSTTVKIWAGVTVLHMDAKNGSKRQPSLRFFRFPKDKDR